MTTAYSLADTLPQDTGGQPHLALADVQQDAIDYALFKGIGVSAIGNPAFNMGHLAIGTHTQGSAIEAKHPFVSVGGVYIENIGASPAASATTSGSGQIATMTNWGELHVRGAPVAASHMSTSKNLVKNGSGIVYGVTVALSAASEGDWVYIQDGDGNNVLDYISASPYETVSLKIPDGGIVFSTTIQQSQGITNTDTDGGASVTVMYR